MLSPTHSIYLSNHGCNLSSLKESLLLKFLSNTSCCRSVFGGQVRAHRLCPLGRRQLEAWQPCLVLRHWSCLHHIWCVTVCVRLPCQLCNRKKEDQAFIHCHTLSAKFQTSLAISQGLKLSFDYWLVSDQEKTRKIGQFHLELLLSAELLDFLLLPPLCLCLLELTLHLHTSSTMVGTLLLAALSAIMVRPQIWWIEARIILKNSGLTHREGPVATLLIHLDALSLHLIIFLSASLFFNIFIHSLNVVDFERRVTNLHLYWDFL